jgi:hypothetical protein
MISRAGRPGFAANDLFGGTMPERAQGFVAYAGRYRFDGDRVVHHVELSLFPNWVGSDQERAVELSGPVDPERQPAAAWGKVAGAPPGLGAGPPVVGHHLLKEARDAARKFSPVRANSPTPNDTQVTGVSGWTVAALRSAAFEVTSWRQGSALIDVIRTNARTAAVRVQNVLGR